jgi:hypothetical protein
MSEAPVLSRGSLLLGAAGPAAGGAAGAAMPAAGSTAASGGRTPLWTQAARRGIAVRDHGVADVYRRYLGTLDHRAVKALISFGLSDRYTWLQEDLPREDGAARRPLPFDEDLQPKPPYRALSHSLKSAPWPKPVRRLHRDH